MEFSLQKSQFAWNKKSQVSEDDKHAIMQEIESMTTQIQEALEFTKKLCTNGHETEVKFYFNTETSKDYLLAIYYEQPQQAWAILIVDTHNKAAGEIRCNDPSTVQFIEDG
jgi:hypothetical protein